MLSHFFNTNLSFLIKRKYNCEIKKKRIEVDKNLYNFDNYLIPNYTINSIIFF